MNEYEIHVTASYTPAGTKYWNCFKSYINADNEAEAKAILKDQLENEGYEDIEMETYKVN